MTSDRDPNEQPRPIDQGISMWVAAVEDGGAIVHVTWHSDSPWVPGGSLRLATENPRILNMGYKALVEGVIIQLRPIMQAMLVEVWPPF